MSVSVNECLYFTVSFGEYLRANERLLTCPCTLSSQPNFTLFLSLVHFFLLSLPLHISHISLIYPNAFWFFCTDRHSFANSDVNYVCKRVCDIRIRICVIFNIRNKMGIGFCHLTCIKWWINCCTNVSFASNLSCDYHFVFCCFSCCFVEMFNHVLFLPELCCCCCDTTHKRNTAQPK